MNPQDQDRIRDAIKAEYERFAGKQHPQDFPALPPMPTARYADPEFWDLEQRYLWKKSWLLAGHVDELPNPGSFKLWDDTGTPIILVRGQDQVIRAFYNCCNHRGGPLTFDRAGTARVFVCKYHCWTYELDGRLRHVPDQHEFPGLEKSCYNLQPLRVEQWGNFLFVNQDREAEPLEDFLGPMKKLFEDFDFSKRRIYATVTYEMDCNWKVGLDNNAEAYHVIAVHPQSVHKMLDYHGNVLGLYPRGHNSVVSPRRRSEEGQEFNLLDLGSNSDDPRFALTRETIGSVVVFPNLMISYGEFQFPFITYWPTAIGKTRMVVYYSTPNQDEDPDSPVCRQVVDGFGYALDEDRAPLSAVQSAYEKGLIKEAKLGYTERRLYHFHEELDRVIGPERIPEYCRMQMVIPDSAVTQ